MREIRKNEVLEWLIGFYFNYILRKKNLVTLPGARYSSIILKVGSEPHAP
jgi:hypothetical protein